MDEQSKKEPKRLVMYVPVYLFNSFTVTTVFMRAGEGGGEQQT